MVRRSLAVFLLALFLASCSHAPPRVVQVFSQVTRVFDPVAEAWSSRLSVFVQATSDDGNRVFDRLHLVHDGQDLFFTLTRDQWTTVERPGEYWVGANGLSFPDGQVPTGTWRVLLVTRAGLEVQTAFTVPPQPPGVALGATGPVRLREDPGTPGKLLVSGWVPDTLAWVRDSQGTIISRVKASGDSFLVPMSAWTVTLYSYDKIRGEGIEAGPFSLKAAAKPADR